MTTRREFLRQAGLMTAAVAASPAVALAAQDEAASPAVDPPGSKPRRIIFLVSDGMSQGVPTLAHQLSLQVRGKGTHFHHLLSQPTTSKGMFECHSLESLVTDSAAASTAWGAGVRILNRGVNTLADGTRLTPILNLLKAQGYGTGLVTTARVTHATPAGFASAVDHRDKEEDIAPQYLNVVDVILGGGQEIFDPTLNKAKTDLAAPYAEKGYTVVKDREALRKAPPKGPILGIFSKGHLPYTVDQNFSEDLQKSIPTLAEMTEHALAVLQGNEKGFLLQVEGARVDHAAHGNDIAGVLWDQIAFDDAIGVALEFQKKNPDTLIVVTSDHGNSNPGLNGSGPDYSESNPSFARVAQAKASFTEIEDRLKKAGSAKDKPVSPEVCLDILRGALGLEFTLEEAGQIARAAAGEKFVEANRQHSRMTGLLGQLAGNYNGIGWTGSQHTEDHTIIVAQGPGQEAFGRLLPNTECFSIFTEYFGIKHRNPTMGLEEALKLKKTRQAAMLGKGLDRHDWA